MGLGSDADPQVVWAAVVKLLPASLARLERSLFIHQLTDRLITLKVVPGSGNAYLTDRQQASLGEVFGKVLGKPTQIQIERPVQSQAFGGAHLGGVQGHSSGGAGGAGGESGGESGGGGDSGGAFGGASGGGGGRTSGEERQAAMALPLVRQIQENFSVTLIDVRSVPRILEKKDEPNVDV